MFGDTGFRRAEESTAGEGITLGREAQPVRFGEVGGAGQPDSLETKVGEWMLHPTIIYISRPATTVLFQWELARSAYVFRIGSPTRRP
jgi:hypothetical protein